MGLLAADLRALANLPTTRIGRRLFVGTCVGFGLLAMLSWWFAQTILDQPQLLALLNRLSGDDPQHALFGYGLMACPLVATWLGLALAQRQLFDAPELLLWRQAPIAPWRGAFQVLLRSTFLSVCWASALALPFVGAVLVRSPAPAWAWAIAALAIVGATMPLLATLLAMHVVLVRFFAGRWLRMGFVLVSALASVGFSAWLLVTLFGRGQEHSQVLAIARAPESLPWTVDTGAALLAAAARGTLARDSLIGLVGWLAFTLVMFRFVAHLHPRAYERHLAAEPPLWRGRGRHWPASIAAVVRNKEFAQLLQQPGAVIGFLVFAVLVFSLVRRQVLVGGILGNPDLPRDVAQCGAMLTQWFLAVLLVLYAHMGRLVLWDGGQWSLWVASPATPFAILRGKLTAILVFLLWPLLLVGCAGALTVEASGPALLAFAGIAFGGTLTALGVLAAVGTWPRLMRPDESGQVAPGSKGFLGSILLVLTFYLALSPAAFGWHELVHLADAGDLTDGLVHQWMPTVVAAACAYGLVIGALGVWLGTCNFRRLLLPR